MTGGGDPGADDADPTLAQEAGTAVAGRALGVAGLTRVRQQQYGQKT